MARLTLISIALTIFVASTLAVVPSYIKVCGRRDPNLSKCVENSVASLRKKLEEGIPELEVPSVEPLDVGEVTLADLTDFRAVALNVQLRGLSNFDIKYLKLDLDDQIIDIDVVFPKINLDSEYDVKARILVPITEKGPINVITENVKAKVIIKFKTVKRRGQLRMFFPTMTTKVTVNDFKAIFKPDANDSPITQAINSVLVSSRQEIIESMIPNLEKAISLKVLDVSNRISKHFSYDDLFPDRP